MGKSSGGVRSGGDGGGPKNPVKNLKGATEAGYTDKMVRNIVGLEQNYRRNKDETLHIFSPTGDLIRSIGGKGAQVRFAISEVPEGSILTHNHPLSLGKKGINRIGNSFSNADIQTAIRTNAREIRAVTPTYTFSIKRPKGGWGVSAEKIRSAFNDAENKVDRALRRYLDRWGWSENAVNRANAVKAHKINKILAAQFGWNYTKKNR
jgi:hypothetical protein